MITPVVLCGGAGKRLWPLSRPDMPKPTLRLFGDHTLLALTLERVAEPGAFAPPLVVTGADYEHLMTQIVRSCGVSARFIIEPFGRDTAAAIASAACVLPPDELMLVLPADHLIRDAAAFRATVLAAAPLAGEDRLVVFGVTPDAPSTAYGYIQPGEALRVGRRVATFREKPVAGAAVDLVAAGYLWNSGIFLMRAGAILAELEAHAPDILAAVREALPSAPDADGTIRIDGAAFAECPSTSIDYAVMERTDRAAVVEAAFDWSDVGTWSSVIAAAEMDDDGNVVRGDAAVVDTRNSLVISERPRVGVVGLDNAVVVASDEAVLVTTRDKADTVKALVAAMEEAPEKVIGDFIRHNRPWGQYQTLDLGAGYQVKRLVVKPGRRLSLQKHAHRMEHWTVVQGVAEVTLDENTFALRPNETVHVPLGAVHRLANPGDAPVVVIEVQCGDYLGEDDIVRLEDDFGRDEADA